MIKNGLTLQVTLEVVCVLLFDLFSIWVFFYIHSRLTGQQRKGRLLLYFICTTYTRFMITAESSPLQIASRRLELNREPLVSERKSLTARLHVLHFQTSAPKSTMLLKAKNLYPAKLHRHLFFR